MGDVNKSVLGLEKFKFTHMKGMKKKWIESGNDFLTYLVTHFGKSAKASLLAGKVVVTEIAENLIPKFDDKKTRKTTWWEWSIGNRSCIMML